MSAVTDSSPPEPDTNAIMQAVRERVRTELRDRLVARGAADDFGDPGVFDDVDALFRRALAHDDRHALLLPELLSDEWRPELSLRLTSHRPGMAAALVLFVKRRLVLPLTRWLFEYALENFRRQDRLNVALMACLQSLAADHARLQIRLETLETHLRRREGAVTEPSTSSR
jgi:hypothetical protein